MDNSADVKASTAESLQEHVQHLEQENRLLQEGREQLQQQVDEMAVK